MNDGHFIDDPLYVVNVEPDFSGLGMEPIHPTLNFPPLIFVSHRRNVNETNAWHVRQALISKIQSKNT